MFRHPGITTGVHGVASLTMDGDVMHVGLVEPAGELAVRAARTLLGSAQIH